MPGAEGGRPRRRASASDWGRTPILEPVEARGEPPSANPRATLPEEAEMTPGDESDHHYHRTLRYLASSYALPVQDRVALIRGLIPSVARELPPFEFDALIAELRKMGQQRGASGASPDDGLPRRPTVDESDGGDGG